MHFFFHLYFHRINKFATSHHLNHENFHIEPHFSRKEFVELYIDFILNKSVETQFDAFYSGFMKVCGGPIMELFRAPELMGLIIGNENYDWDAFEQSTQYKSGYTSGDPTVCSVNSKFFSPLYFVDNLFVLSLLLLLHTQIRLFWEVFHELPLEDKKKFLLFLTGSDRIAIGTKALQVCSSPNFFFPYANYPIDFV